MSSEPLLACQTNPREGGPTFTLKNRIERLVWTAVWRTLGIWTPVPFHKWRRLLLLMFGARVDITAKIYPGVVIWYPRNLEMQEYSCLGKGVICYAMDRILLGPHALVSQRVHLCCGTHDIDDPMFQLFAKPIRISKNAWIAAEAFIGPGVTVGEGAILGARGVTVRDLKPWTVYAGNPARKIRERKRFS